jgi:plastocyanin
MDGTPRRRDLRRTTHTSIRLALAAVAAGLAFTAISPSPAGATVTTRTEQFKLPAVGGFDVRQDVQFNVPRPAAGLGKIVRMEADIVDGAGDPIPITQLMLHHIVFINTGRADQSCDSVTGFDNLDSGFPMRERFMAAGEERQRMVLPDGYGYDPGSSPWAVLYMVMNHKPDANTDAYIRYTMTYDDDPGLVSVTPWWLDVNNCNADPIYNVKGTGDDGDENVRVQDFPLTKAPFASTGGRVVAAGGHVHGGAYDLRLSQPACGDRTLFTSEPTWGEADHPFYTVRPILHEPGPIHMSAFKSETGFPVASGESLRLSSAYDDSQPHTRVMGILIAYVAPDPGVTSSTDSCEEPLPTDVIESTEPPPGRADPVPFEIPLVAEDSDAPGGYVEINHPPGKLQEVKSGTRIRVSDSAVFSRPNVKIHQGDRLEWRFTNSRSNLHNVTLANGPQAIGSPNLSRDEAGDPRTFERRFKSPGTYRLFCALHPTLMHERVVVRE